MREKALKFWLFHQHSHEDGDRYMLTYKGAHCTWGCNSIHEALEKLIGFKSRGKATIVPKPNRNALKKSITSRPPRPLNDAELLVVRDFFNVKIAA